MQNFTDWFKPYLLSDQNGLNTSALLDDFADLAGSSLKGLSRDEVRIADACLHAVLWGYPLAETYRYRQLDTKVQAKENMLFKPSSVASWLNKNSAPAPNASALYVTSWLNLNKGDRILQTPANTDENYYIWAILDSYINTVGSIGPRTQSKSKAIQNSPSYYLLAGPSSPYYSGNDWLTTLRTMQGDRTVRIIRVDTPYAWVTARFGSDTLNESALANTHDFINGAEDSAGSGFQITSIDHFQRTGSVPYQEPISQSSTNEKAEKAQKKWGSIPSTAKGFFDQLGTALQDSPVPAQIKRGTFTNIPDEAIWLGNQNKVQNALGGDHYLPTSSYQPSSALSSNQTKALNKRFSTIGLNLSRGFTMPSDWNSRDREIFEESYRFSNNLLSKATTNIASGAKATNYWAEATNYWHIGNYNMGVYPNTWHNWLVRCGVAIDGGAANIPNDGVYPTTQLDHGGNSLSSSYNYTITLPPLSEKPGGTTYGPANGFWSFTIYQPNAGSAYQPFLVENAINNLSYTSIDARATLTANGWLRTAKPDNWNNSTAEGTALRTGVDGNIEGLDADTTYYVQTTRRDHSDENNLLIKLSANYEPSYNIVKGTPGVPIGGQGSPGPAIDLSATAAGSTMSFGWIQPVAQLGSAQQDRLEVNEDGNIVLELRADQPSSARTNWLPTPNSGWSRAAHDFQVMARYYEPTEDNPTILAAVKRPSRDDIGGPIPYIPPRVERKSLRRLCLWEQLDDAGRTLLQQRTGSSTIDPMSGTDRFDADAVGAILDLRWAEGALEGSNWDIRYDYSRNADYINKLFFYRVDDVTGLVNDLRPGDTGYKAAALARRVNADQPISNAMNNSTNSGTLRLEGGAIYMPLVFTDAGEQLLPNARSTGNISLFSLVESDAFAFDDQLSSGDQHNNDGLFRVTGLTPVA